MLFLTPHESTVLRHQIIRDLQNDSYVEIDSRFVKPIFGGFANMRRWCDNWSIKYETFIRPGEFRSDKKTPYRDWVSFKYPEPEQVVIV